jgi:hypothetical protein
MIIDFFSKTKVVGWFGLPYPLKRGFFKKRTNFQKIMEKGDAANEKLIFFLHYHLNAFYAAQITFIFLAFFYHTQLCTSGKQI